MRIPVALWQGPAAALLAVVLAADTVQAQPPEVTIRGNLSLLQTLRASNAPGPPGGTGTTYPYWSSAPQSFTNPTPITVPVPAPVIIANAVVSAPPQTSVGVGLGGGFIPPFVTAREAILDSVAHIWLRVPESAEIWVNGVKTKQTGESRYFFSPPLTPGKKYSYQMRLRWMKDGKPVEEKQRILVEAGVRISRDFTHSR